MRIPTFDHDYINESVKRLSGLPHDKTPAWGRMTPGALPSHLAGLLLYSMGRGEPLEDRSNWVQRNVLKRVMLMGLLPIPKNINVPDQIARQLAPPKPYDVESLHALMDEYVNLVLNDGIDPPPHPILGPFTVDDWATFHCLHFEHHFKQFGI